VPCVSQKFYETCDDCPDEKTCRLKRVFIDVREQTYELLSGITIESFLDSSQKPKFAAKTVSK
jgi:DNA-binding IscR family transcriptional regulator